MSTSFAILRTHPLRLGDIPVAHAHNCRRIATPNADPDVLDGVKILRCDGTDALDAYWRRVKSAGARPAGPRRYALVEVVLALSPNHETPPSEEEFIKRNVKFLDDLYGRKNIICIELHKDEKSPHIHAFAIPICQGTPPGRRHKGAKLEKQAVISWNRFSGSDRPRGFRPTNNPVLSQWQSAFGRVWADLGYRRGIPSRRDHLFMRWVRGKTAAIQELSKMASDDFYRELDALQPTQAGALRYLKDRLARRFEAIIAPLQEMAARGIQLDVERKERVRLSDDNAALRAESAEQQAALNALEAENQVLRERTGAKRAMRTLPKPDPVPGHLPAPDKAKLEQGAEPAKPDHPSVDSNEIADKRPTMKPLPVPKRAPESTPNLALSGP